MIELKSTAGADKRLDSYVAGIQERLTDKAGTGSLHGYDATGFAARELTERLALALQASLVVRYSVPAVADAFIASRLAGQHGQAFGTLPAGVDVDGIMQGVTEPLG